MALTKILIFHYTVKQWNNKSEKFLEEVNTYRGYASTYDVEILNSYNPNLQLKDNKYGNKNKLIDLVS